MTDKQIISEIATLEGTLYSIMHAIGVLLATKNNATLDEALDRMQRIANSHAIQRLNVLEARYLTGNQ